MRHGKIDVTTQNEIPVDFVTLTAQISAAENSIFIVKDGRVIRRDGPPSGFGKQTITWQDGKPVHEEISTTSKL
ncbi:DUF3954 domain-containing protein [Alkalihalobacillus clausii]|nr:DUF3954 domain-containing protein [Shouchella clausii]